MKPLRFLMLLNDNVEIDRYLKTCRDLSMNCVVANPFIQDIPGFQEKVRRAGLPLGLNFPVFFDQAYLEKHPDALGISSEGEKTQKDWLYYACPSNLDFRQYQISELRKWLRKLKPELVSLDFIRHYAFWETIPKGTGFSDFEEGCYCPLCRENLAAQEGIELKDLSPEQLKKEYPEELSRFRKNLLEEMLKELCALIREWNPDLPIYLKLVPWTMKDKGGARKDLLGQDLEMMSPYCDGFSVMSYLHTIGEAPKKISEIQREIRKVTDKPVIYSLQAQPIYDEGYLTLERSGEFLEEAQLNGDGGINIFDYHGIVAERDRYLWYKERF